MPAAESRQKSRLFMVTSYSRAVPDPPAPGQPTADTTLALYATRHT